ncbi:MAG: proline racemase family protein [Actinobacteria bacterium]|nr:proline racemase family protein [Actinomycetota bacterium]
MRARRLLQAVDSHTEGMPTRVVTGGVGVIPGATMLDRRAHFEAEMDDLRLLLMREPRGHAAMSGAILQPPTLPGADWGVLFIEVSGCLAMCGHGTIGVATVLIETGMVEVHEPETTIRLEVPAGLIEARVAVEAGRAKAVTIRNVASFLHRRDLALDVPGHGELSVDVAFGGNFYAIAPAAALGLTVEPERADELIAAGAAVMAAVEAAERPVHPDDERIAGCRHVVLHEPGRDGAHARSATSIHPGWLDRSACGTGTSARLAQLHARSEIAGDEAFVNESVIGSRFIARAVEQTTVGGTPAIVPEVTGRAWISGLAQYVLDPDDPFPTGFSL